MAKFGDQPINKKNGAEAWGNQPLLRALGAPEEGTVHTSMRFNKATLKGLAIIAKKKGISRSAYINLVLTEAVEKENKKG